MYRVQHHVVTAHEAIGGRHCNTPVCPFCDYAQWKRHAGGLDARKAESEWFDGACLGVRPISGECIVGSSNGVVYCRTIRRVIESDRWSMQAIKDVSQTVRQVECDRHRGAQPDNLSPPELVSWSDIGPDRHVDKDDASTVASDGGRSRDKPADPKSRHSYKKEARRRTVMKVQTLDEAFTPMLTILAQKKGTNTNRPGQRRG